MKYPRTRKQLGYRYAGKVAAEILSSLGLIVTNERLALIGDILDAAWLKGERSGEEHERLVVKSKRGKP